MIDETTHRQCSRCGAIKLLEGFPTQKRCRQGRRSTCKDCYNLHVREWRAAHPKRVKVAAKKWRDNNLDKVAAAQRRWRLANPEKAKKTAKEWRDNNPEKVKASRRRYYLTHPEIFREQSKRWRAAHSFFGTKIGKLTILL